MESSELRELTERSAHLSDRLVAWRRDLHMHPELAFEEKRTAGIVEAAMRELGLLVHARIGGYGVVAELRGTMPGRTIALRADMDALPVAEETELPFASKVPGVMHACGHDAHTAMLLGAASLLAECRNRIRGTVRFLFQSAEEIVAGAKSMIADGALDGVDEIYGLHNLPTLAAGRIATRYGALMGSVDRIEVTLEGKGGHGAMPDQCADPIVAAAAVVMGLQTAVSREVSPFDPAVITIGSIQAGQTNNVIPSRGHLTGTIRTMSPSVQAAMPERIERIVGRIAEGFRCRGQVKYVRQVPALVSDDACVAHVNRIVDGLLGPERRLEAAPTLAGEDFSVYLERVPGCFFWLGSGPEQGAAQAYGLHHPRFDIDERCLAIGASVLAAIALDRLGEGNGVSC